MTEKVSPGDRETWWQQQVDELKRENAKLTESYWNMSRSMKLTQEERDAAESRLAAASALLTEWLASRYVSKGNRADRVKRTRTFLANQPATPAKPARCRDCGGPLTVIPDGFGEAYTCTHCDKPAAPTRPLTCLRTEGENGRGEHCRLPMVHTGQCQFYDEPFKPMTAAQMNDATIVFLGDHSRPTKFDQPAAPTRTEAEQAVLADVAGVSDEDWKFIKRNGSGPIARIGNSALEYTSEIARRGLK